MKVKTNLRAGSGSLNSGGVNGGGANSGGVKGNSTAESISLATPIIAVDRCVGY